MLSQLTIMKLYSVKCYKEREGVFFGRGNLELYHQCWLPEDEPEAVLLVVHGLGEHCGRYQNVVRYFVPKGYAVYAFDHQGHGKSKGARMLHEKTGSKDKTLHIYDGFFHEVFNEPDHSKVLKDVEMWLDRHV